MWFGYLPRYLSFYVDHEAGIQRIRGREGDEVGQHGSCVTGREVGSLEAEKKYGMFVHSNQSCACFLIPSLGFVCFVVLSVCRWA